MAKPSYALFDNFELKGIWWLPDKPEAQINVDPFVKTVFHQN
jgi:hypothetical protein